VGGDGCLDLSVQVDLGFGSVGHNST
jgi:hypothetical protein